jgi:hypothetical protein
MNCKESYALCGVYSHTRITLLYAAKWICTLLAIFMTGSAYSQNIAINADGSLPNPNAMLDIKSGNKGLLIPRMTTNARLRIPHTQGLMVYDINTNSFWYNTGRAWQNLAADAALASISDSAWLLTGNAGTVDGTHFLGTTDNVPLNIRVNNQRSGRIDHINGNTFWGFRSGFSVTSGNDNTGVGASALFAITTGYNNTAVGSNALQSNSTGYHNSAFGRFALMSNSSGYNNAANGTGALLSNTTGYHNTATGVDALNKNTTGNWNTANGIQAMFSNINGGFNTANGGAALYSNTDGFYNTATGVAALYSNTGGYLNTANGTGTLYNNTNGTANTAAGYEALLHNITGTGNTANGAGALGSTREGGFNTAVGVDAFYYNLNGSYNTAIGAYADQRSVETLNNGTAIGYAAIVNASNKVRLGNAAVTVIEGQVPFSSPADGRFKFQVQEDVKGLDFILALRPVTYQSDTKRFDTQLDVEGTNNPIMDAAYNAASSIRRSGFIAQEVEQAANEAGYNFSGIIAPGQQQRYYGLSYEVFVVPLVKAMQEQQQLINNQQKAMQDQNKKIADLQQQLNEMKVLLKSSK